MRQQPAIALVLIFLCTVTLLSVGAPYVRRYKLDSELMVAVRANNLGAVRSLLARGASIEVRDTSGAWRTRDYTPLMLAVSQSNESMVQLLLARGADPNAKQRSLGGVESYDVALSTAAKKGDLTIARLLLDAGSPVDARSGMNMTPLMLAVMRDHVDVVELLIARGADVNAKDDRGFTPMSIALANHRRNQRLIVRQLLRVDLKRR